MMTVTDWSCYLELDSRSTVSCGVGKKRPFVFVIACGISTSMIVQSKKLQREQGVRYMRRSAGVSWYDRKDS